MEPMATRLGRAAGGQVAQGRSKEYLMKKGANEMIHAEYSKRLAQWDKFKDLSEEAHGE